MTTFWATRKWSMLFPDSPEALAELEKLPIGEPLLVTVKRPRNAKHHRFYWALCNRIATAIGADAENVSDVLKISTGHFRTIETKSYGTIKLPKSISFAKMGQTEFSEFFDKCLEMITTEWAIAKPDILDAIKDLIEPS